MIVKRSSTASKHSTSLTIGNGVVTNTIQQLIEQSKKNDYKGRKAKSKSSICDCEFDTVAPWAYKDQLILATFSLVIPKVFSDKSESGGKWILFSHWLISSIWRILNQWENRIYFPPLSNLSEHSFGISGPNINRISWNFEWYQLFILVGPGGNRDRCKFHFKMYWVEL